ncbi:MAG: hypothetical protein JO154_05500 [Chitinophaga sp.]|uniref:hypothetical protein n=1 Tax=Chitinophaga sp. TaxID=1869181 RepID=UPI0025BC88CB|nr:hypothetical protein [Chitinophaga sp.]MBV8252043.1 hypothetical protein [Chitinophaga sp.]
MEPMHQIPVFAINLKKRPERKEHITAEFVGRDEFQLEVVAAIEEENGRMGLWKTIHQVVSHMKAMDMDYGIICEDDHYFTTNYSHTLLQDTIWKCQLLQADALLGGVSWFQGFVPVTEKLCWIERFTGLQFCVVFKKFYDQILDASFTASDAADLKFWEISEKIFLLHPFISKQKEFGYSDTTERNNEPGAVTRHFQRISAEIASLSTLSTYYQQLGSRHEKAPITNIEEPFKLPVLTIEPASNKGCPAYITDLNAIPATNLHQRITQIIQQGLECFIIARAPFNFLTDAELGYLLSNIREAAEEGADCLCIGCADFGQSFPITSHRFWISSFSSASLLVIFPSFYESLLQMEDRITPDNLDYLLSKQTIYKMLLMPVTTVLSNSPGKEDRKGANRIHVIRRAFDQLAVHKEKLSI